MQDRAVKDISTAFEYGTMVLSDRNTVPESLLLPLIPMSKKKPAKAAPKPAQQERAIPLIWNVTEDIVSGYATNMLVQFGEHEFFVSFFETVPPLLLDPKDVDKLESVTAECIARVVIAPDRIKGFIDVLQRQLDAFNERQKAQATTDVPK